MGGSEIDSRVRKMHGDGHKVDHGRFVVDCFEPALEERTTRNVT